jgi:hypothetical protein
VYNVSIRAEFTNTNASIRPGPQWVIVRRLRLSFGGASMTGEQVVQLGGGMIGDAAPHASASQARGSAR